MTQEEMRKEFYALYNLMANSGNVAFMRTFGIVHKEMMEWMIQNRPESAQEWIEKLESIRWRNYLTKKEAQAIVEAMDPKAPWTMEQWQDAMQKHGYELQKEPCYNRCAMYVTMNMIYSDSHATLTKYIGNGDVFAVIHDLAKDKLEDKDKRFCIRTYFGL